jgi:hypothetical protein
MNKFEKLIEFIINDEDQKARELFHDIVVEKSRDIYESIMDEESMEETVAGAQVEELANEVGHDETQAMEDEGEEEFGGDDEFAGDDAGEEFGGEEGEAEEHAEIEDQVMNIDAKLDELLAKFDEIMGDEGHGEEMGHEEPAMGDDEGHEEMGGEEPAMFEGENPFAKSGKSGKSGSAASGKSGSATSGKSGKSGKGSAELMREYVDKIGEIYGGQGDAAEGDAVGAAGKKTAVNTKPGSIGPGNNFGGTAVTSKGGNQDQDGTSPTKASNEYTKGQGEIKSGNRNVPGGKADSLESTGTKYETEHKPEGKLAGADGSRPVNAKSVQAQNTGKK